MYVQKSFIANTTFANNTPGTVAQLGELSAYGASFSREKGFYSDKTTAPNLVLISFISKDDTTAIPIPTSIAAETLAICNFVYNQTLGGVTDITAAVLLENLLTNFQSTASDFASGNMVSDGSHTLPEWVSWTDLTDTTRPGNFIKVWFVDSSFQAQYDETEIYVIPPFDTLDNFFQPGDAVQGYMAQVTSSGTMDRIQAAKQGYPESVIRTNTFNWIDPLNTTHTIPTDWSVLIYGPVGDNPDSIKDAIIAYILANSTHTQTEWTGIFPDIFKRTEFILLPLWDQYAIPNRQLATGIYSPQMVYANVAAKMKQYATQYPSAHIDSNLTLMNHPYRSLALLAVGSPDNRNAIYQLSQMFTDWISVSSSSVDFNRMGEDTQEWAEMIEAMIFAAESAGDFTTIPVGMTKVHRDGILYLAKPFQNVNYLVVTKSNMV